MSVNPEDLLALFEPGTVEEARTMSLEELHHSDVALVCWAVGRLGELEGRPGEQWALIAEALGPKTQLFLCRHLIEPSAIVTLPIWR